MQIEEEEEEFAQEEEEGISYGERDRLEALTQKLITLPEGNVGVELVSRSVDIGHHFNLIISMLMCRKICLDVSAYVFWNESKAYSGRVPEEERFTPRAIEGFHSFEYWLQEEVPDLLEYGFFDVDLGSIQKGLNILKNYQVSSPPQDECSFDFDLAGFYRVNPGYLRLLAAGGTTAIVVLTLTFGAVQITKEANAGACRAIYSELIKGERETLEKLGRLQGRLTEGQQASHEKSIKAILAASAACGSLLANIGINMNLLPNMGFSITLSEQKKDGPA